MTTKRFLTSFGVMEISKSNGFDTYDVYLNRYFAGSIVNHGAYKFYAANPEKNKFSEDQQQIIIDMAIGKIKPQTFIKPIGFKVYDSIWHALRCDLDKYEIWSNTGSLLGIVVKDGTELKNQSVNQLDFDNFKEDLNSKI